MSVSLTYLKFLAGTESVILSPRNNFNDIFPKSDLKKWPKMTYSYKSILVQSSINIPECNDPNRNSRLQTFF